MLQRQFCFFVLGVAIIFLTASHGANQVLGGVHGSALLPTTRPSPSDGYGQQRLPTRIQSTASSNSNAIANVRDESRVSSVGSPEIETGRTKDNTINNSVGMGRISRSSNRTAGTKTTTAEDEIQQRRIDQHHFIFPGGGIYFYWQAGFMCYLREQGYDLSPSSQFSTGSSENGNGDAIVTTPPTTFTGASAGALTATLTATNVDFYDATELALRLAKDANVWNRGPYGLQGIWGPMIYEWLDTLLPSTATASTSSSPASSSLMPSNLSLLVTPIPNVWDKRKVSIFQNRRDLIKCNMASVHIVRTIACPETYFCHEVPLVAQNPLNAF